MSSFSFSGSRRLAAASLAAACPLAIAASAATAAPKPTAKVSVSGAASAELGKVTPFAVTLKSSRGTIAKGSLTLLLSTDKKRDKKDVQLTKQTVKKIKAGKGTTVTVQATVPAKTKLGSYRLLVCVAVAAKTTCAAKKLDVKAATIVPGSTGPTGPVSNDPGPRPGSGGIPDPGPGGTPDPGPGQTDPDVVVNTPSPSPGSSDQPAVDPATKASALTTANTTSHRSANAFLYSGADPIQVGLTGGTITTQRSAVLRGRVLDRSGNGVGGIRVTVVGHAEYGRTATRTDGGYDLAVNGGGLLTLKFEREGWISAQREVDVPWQDYADVDTVVLVRYDAQATKVDTGENAVAAAQGTTTTDSSGTRTQTLLFDPGTTAQMTVSGASQPLGDAFTVRSTEFTAGPTGQDAMPGQLPPTSAYTYAAEFSIDEAVAAGATDVAFSKPVATYVENFLGFPVGTPVPAGYYDRQRGEWVGAPNGRVVKLLAGGVDTDGDGAADNTGIDAAELAKLATLYAVGTELWRVEVTHFTPWDYNYPYGPPDDARGPDDQAGPKPPPDPNNPCPGKGSIILCEDQILGEALGITGTDEALVYRSDAVPGRSAERSVDIKLVGGGSLPPTVDGVTLMVKVAGRAIKQSFTRAQALATPTYTFVWDGNDAYGRRWNGYAPGTINIGYSYKPVYKTPAAFASSWARVAATPSTVATRAAISYSKDYAVKFASFDARGVGLGGWGLSELHSYDPAAQTVRLGSGQIAGLTANRQGALATATLTGATLDGPAGIATDAAGNIYVADARAQRIRRVSPSGAVDTIAGTGAFGYRPADDGAAATAARLSSPQGVAVTDVGGQTTIYVADTSAARIRRFTPGGSIVTVAGGGGGGGGSALGDGGPATSARLALPGAVAVGPDGALYIADTAQHRVRVVGTDGTITTLAGDGTAGFGGDGGPASAARLSSPGGLAVRPDGTVLIADSGNGRVRQVTPDGRIATLVGGGSSTANGAAPLDSKLLEPVGLSLDVEKRLLIADARDGKIRQLTGDGYLRTVAGGGTETRGSGIPATATPLQSPTGVATDGEGTIIVSEPESDRLTRITRPMPGFTDGDQLIASEDGTEVFQFNAAGRHERTLSSLTGATKRRFTYDAQGRLDAVFDDAAGASPQHAAVLTVDRSVAGQIALRARGNANTTLALDAQGWVDHVVDPAGGDTNLDHSATGLLTGETDPVGAAHAFTYDGRGRLLTDSGPDGISKSLTRTQLDNGRQVTVNISGGTTTTYKGVVNAAGDYERTVTEASGAVTSSTLRSDGSLSIEYPDGTTLTQRAGPDPRFGMQSPVPVLRRTTTPSGKTNTVTVTRTATMRTGDTSRLKTLTDTIDDNGKVGTQIYQTSAGSGGNAAGDFGGVFTTTTQTGKTATVTLDARGRVIAGKHAGAVPVTTTFDDANDGRVSSIAQGARVWTYGYDARQRITSRTDGEGLATTFSYDGADRLLSTTRGSLTWATTYDAAGSILTQTSPGGRVASGTVTAGGRLASLNLPGTAGAYDRTYGSRGQTLTLTRPSGARGSTTYESPNLGGRAANQVEQRAPGLSPVTGLGFTYSGNTDLLTSGTWQSGATTTSVATTYDGSFPLSSTLSGAATGKVSRTLSATGGQITATKTQAGAGAPVTYAQTYDNDRQLASYGPFTIARNATSGNAEIYTDAADGTVVQDRDTQGFGELDERTVTESGASKYALTVERDDTGRVRRRTESIAGGASIVRTYEYDGAGRLTIVKDGGGATVEGYAYNADGDRTSATSEDHTAQLAGYDPVSHLQTAAGPLTTTFDVDGYLTERGTDTYNYAPGGELLSASVGATTVSYAYDVGGRLVKRTAGADATTFLYGDLDHGLRVTASVDTAGVLTSYFYDEIGHLHALERGGTRYRVGADQVGTPRVVIDGAGTIVKRVDRDSFGRILSDTAPAFALPLGFAGGIEDPDTGLIRFGARDYDPQTGRWTARDPAFFNGSRANLYAYADSQPTTRVDSTGLWSLGGSAYSGIGGGGSISYDPATGEYGFCVEIGVGAGGGAELDIGAVPEDSGGIAAEAGYAVPGQSVSIGGEVGLTHGPCPDDPVQITAKAGVKVQGGLVTGSVDTQGGGSVTLTGPALEAKAGAKVALKKCYKVSSWW